ncbi:hypothetical protein ACETU7_31835 [Rhodococcus sp. 3Y1]
MIATSFQSGGVEYTLTRAEIRHVEALIDLLADDPIGSTRRRPTPKPERSTRTRSSESTRIRLNFSSPFWSATR